MVYTTEYTVYSTAPQDQCCGSGSKSDPYSAAFLIRIHISMTDPDPLPHRYKYGKLKSKSVRLWLKITVIIQAAVLQSRNLFSAPTSAPPQSIISAPTQAPAPASAIYCHLKLYPTNGTGSSTIRNISQWRFFFILASSKLIVGSIYYKISFWPRNKNFKKACFIFTFVRLRPKCSASDKMFGSDRNVRLRPAPEHCSASP